MMSFSLHAAESMTDTLTVIGDDINREPWESYQILQELEPQLVNSSEEEQLWFLLRKAQAQNLLYFYDEFAETVEEGIKKLSDDSPIMLSSSFTFYKGITLQRDSQYQEASTLFNQAMELAKEEDLKLLYLEIKKELAYTKSLYENFAISLADLQEAYIEAYYLKDDFLLGMINESYGAIYGYMHEYDKSEEYYRKALDTYQSLNFRAHVAEAVYGLASTYRYWGKYDLAIENYERYIDVVNYTPNQNITFYGAYGLGMTLAEKNDCETAISIIDHALSLSGPIDYKAELYKRQAICFIHLDNIPEANRVIHLANDIFNLLPELTGTRWQLETLKIIADITYLQGDISTAYTLFNDYHEKYTELLKLSTSKRLADLRLNLEIEQKNIEIAFLQQRSQLQKLEVESERQQNKVQQFLIVAILILVFAALVFILNQRRNAKKVYHLSITDPLTNLYNRRFVFDFLKRRIDNERSDKAQMTILLIDIDNFKAINDKYGHPFGDLVIKKIAEISLNTLRAEDVVGRIGGEEFLCALSRIEPTQCVRIAKRLLKNVENYHFIFEQDGKKFSVNVTISVGISQTGYAHNANVAPAIDSTTLYNQADRALYAAKDKGKNTVVDFSEMHS